MCEVLGCSEFRREQLGSRMAKRSCFRENCQDACGKETRLRQSSPLLDGRATDGCEGQVSRSRVSKGQFAVHSLAGLCRGPEPTAAEQ